MHFGPMCLLLDDVSSRTVAGFTAAISHDIHASLTEMAKAHIEAGGPDSATCFLAYQLNKLCHCSLLSLAEDGFERVRLVHLLLFGHLALPSSNVYWKFSLLAVVNKCGQTIKQLTLTADQPGENIGNGIFGRGFAKRSCHSCDSDNRPASARKERLAGLEPAIFPSSARSS